MGLYIVIAMVSFTLVGTLGLNWGLLPSVCLGVGFGVIVASIIHVTVEIKKLQTREAKWDGKITTTSTRIED